LDSGVRKDKLKSGVINSGEIATSGRLVFLRAKSEGVDVDTSVGVAGVVLVRLDKVEVCTFTLGEAILTIKLELTSDNRVLTPAMHVDGCLGKNECTGIRDTRVHEFIASIGCEIRVGVLSIGFAPVITRSACKIDGTSIVEHIVIDVGLSCLSNSIGSTEGMDGVGKNVNSISVVERLCTKNLVKRLATLKR
jgi:hypothetical protein